MVTQAKEARQLYMFDREEHLIDLDAKYWHGSFNGRESTLQQVSPYVGKMKSGMAQVLVSLYSKPGQIVLDPFSGSGVVPLEASLLGRTAWANDLSPYAYTLTRGKLEAPGKLATAIHHAESLILYVKNNVGSVSLSAVPDWIQEFYHPDTLKEIVAAFDYLRKTQDFFLTSCLLGIMHHVRPGFLSYPASHLVPYLRVKKYPPDEFPEMYLYRDLATRLLAKVKRAYRRHQLPVNWETRQYKIWNTNSMALPIEDSAVDAIVSSPPYFGALDYARDNRLRLWFLGTKDWKELDSNLTANRKVYIPQMKECLVEMHRVLRKDGHCALVLGDVDKEGHTRRTAEILAELAVEATFEGFRVVTIYDDKIPDERRSRRQTKTTKFERILVMQKN